MRTICPDSTFLMQSMVPVKPPPQDSPFQGHSLRLHSDSPVLHTDYQPAWIFAILIVATITVTWSVFFYRKRMLQLLYSGFSKRYQSQLIREGDPFKERITISLSLVYVMMFALFVYQANEVWVGIRLNNIPDFGIYLLLVLVISLFWGFKLFMMNVLKMIFRTRDTHHEYTLNILIFTSMSGILLLPVLIFMIYLKSVFFLFLAFGILGLLFFIRFLKGFIIGISLTRFSYLFLFVYLCGLELLPVVILTKLLIRYIEPVF